MKEQIWEPAWTSAKTVALNDTFICDLTLEVLRSHPLTLIKWRHKWWCYRNKSRNFVCWLRNLNFSVETYLILTTSQWILSILWISTAEYFFPVILRYKSENLNKIWKFENPRWRPPVTSFIWLLLPWKPIRHQVVWLNWKYKWSLLYVPSFMSIGWIVLKVEGGGGVRLTPSPPLKASCNYFFFEASRVNGKSPDKAIT